LLPDGVGEFGRPAAGRRGQQFRRLHASRPGHRADGLADQETAVGVLADRLHRLDRPPIRLAGQVLLAEPLVGQGERQVLFRGTGQVGSHRPGENVHRRPRVTAREVEQAEPRVSRLVRRQAGCPGAVPIKPAGPDKGMGEGPSLSAMLTTARAGVPTV